MTTEAAAETTTTEAAADTAPPPVADPPAVTATETAPPKITPTKRAQARATEQRRTMSDEQNGAPTNGNAASQPIPANILQELAEAKAAKAELAKLQAERESFLKEHETVKADVKSLAEKYAQTEAAKLKADEDNRRLRISTAVERAATAHGAVKAEQIVRLLDGVFGLDEKGNVIAADDTKKPVDEYVKEYLARESHLAGRKVAGGSGASPYPAQSGPTAQKNYDLRTTEGATAYVNDRMAAMLRKTA